MCTSHFWTFPAVNSDTLMEEFDMWCRKWEKIAPAEKPTNALEAYLVCDEQFFPNVKKLLQISATLPVSTATNERLFSTLKRLKTYTRSTMRRERLTGLAVLSLFKISQPHPEQLDKLLPSLLHETLTMHDGLAWWQAEIDPERGLNV
uniref:HAT C-terminal dimerisation domain-containing protein n=1 Tax=Anolis carolinensis TaxID=28377 RepID=A0A803U1V3_ANOCA